MVGMGNGRVARWVDGSSLGTGKRSMTTDAWGVDAGYHDIGGQWHETSPETRRAIHASMGVEDAAAGPGQQDPVRVVYPGAPVVWPRPGELRLEDGGTLRVQDHLPADLPLGYHEFHPNDAAGTMLVIAAPKECLTPRGAWGWAVQLYAARSRESWGIGDLADLRRIGRWSAGLGAGLVQVNPLGAAAPVVPQQASPYYPSSRRFLNPLYLRVEEVPGAERLGPGLERLAAAGQALAADRHIGRDAVFRLKEEALRQIWAGFTADDDFDRFCREQGAELDHFAAYCALAALQGGDWRAWPAGYRDPKSPPVRAFARGHPREIGYHKWLQWLLDRQLAAAAEALPLVQDLPIGVDPGGADAWVWQELLAEECTIGAPPDAFNPQGQDWNLPPLVPHKLRAAGYRPFLQTVRAALRRAAGLRIDHVMGLFRLFWIPCGFGPARGAYVRYRADELLAIVALESRRAGAFVVGEDLGTVEDCVRAELAARRVLSFRVLWFEDRPPASCPELAMAAVTTHDLPTVAGLWSGDDLAEQRALGFEAEGAMLSLRRRLAELVGLGDEGAAPTAIAEVIARTYRRLGEAPSLILAAALEDALAVTERPNMPGTISQRPNWCLALPGGIEALETSPLAREIAAALGRTDGQVA